MRDAYYLPWDRQINADGEIVPVDHSGHDAVAYLARKVSNQTKYTETEASEKIYRLIGWMCKTGGANG